MQYAGLKLPEEKGKTMKSVLITGATGNVGIEVIASLRSLNVSLEIIAGVRDIGADALKLAAFDVTLRLFDFTDIGTYDAALAGCSYLFLMRPPAISAVAKYFKPLIAAAKRAGIQHIVFLSVQGAEKSSIIPHHKIETWLAGSGIPYTFLRPAYFMQNFTTTLHMDLVDKLRIFLPAGKAKFTLVDVRDVGCVAAIVLSAPGRHERKIYELTSDEALSFCRMAAQLSEVLGRRIKYVSPTLLQFYRVKRTAGVPRPLILVMMMLHSLPQFQEQPRTTDCIQTITGNLPRTFNDFITDYRAALS